MTRLPESDFGSSKTYCWRGLSSVFLLFYERAFVSSLCSPLIYAASWSSLCTWVEDLYVGSASAEEVALGRLRNILLCKFLVCKAVVRALSLMPANWFPCLRFVVAVALVMNSFYAVWSTERLLYPCIWFKLWMIILLDIIQGRPEFCKTN